MEVGMAEKYSDEALLMNFSAVAKRVHDQAVCDEETSCYTGGRSLADMLSPIKQPACESSNEKSLTLLQSPKDILINDPCVRSDVVYVDTGRAMDGWNTRLPIDLHEGSSFNPCSITAEMSPKEEVNLPINYKTTDSNEDTAVAEKLLAEPLKVLDSVNNELFPKTNCEPAMETNDKIKMEEVIANSAPDKLVGNKCSGSRLDVQDVLPTYKELDTFSLARKVKDVLVANNIGQRIFGQAVLGLTQGSVSDLLSHPKSWQTLSLKGREPFVRMQLWLENPNNVKLIRNLKSEKNADLTGFHSSSSRAKSISSKKKCRVVLSMDEKRALLKAYSIEPYPSQSSVQELSRKLGKKPSTIVNWFHNYRSRVKRGFFGSSDAHTSNLCEEMEKSKTSSNVCSEVKDDVTGDVITKPFEEASSENQTDSDTGEEKLTKTKAKSETEMIKNNEKNSMLLTATVLMGASPKPVSPLWSFHVSDNSSITTSSGNLKTLILNVCGPTRADDSSSKHNHTSQERNVGEENQIDMIE